MGFPLPSYFVLLFFPPLPALFPLLVPLSSLFFLWVWVASAVVGVGRFSYPCSAGLCLLLVLTWPNAGSTFVLSFQFFTFIPLPSHCSGCAVCLLPFCHTFAEVRGCSWSSGPRSLVLYPDCSGFFSCAFVLPVCRATLYLVPHPSAPNPRAIPPMRATPAVLSFRTFTPPLTPSQAFLGGLFPDPAPLLNPQPAHAAHAVTRRPRCVTGRAAAARLPAATPGLRATAAAGLGAAVGPRPGCVPRQQRLGRAAPRAPGWCPRRAGLRRGGLRQGVGCRAAARVQRVSCATVGAAGPRLALPREGLHRPRLRERPAPVVRRGRRPCPRCRVHVRSLASQFAL